MFENCLRFVTDEPITVGKLETLARTGDQPGRHAPLGLYHRSTPRPAGSIASRPGPDAVLRATARGLRAREVWLAAARPRRAALAGPLRRRPDRGAAPRPGRGGRANSTPACPTCLPILGPDPVQPGTRSRPAAPAAAAGPRHVAAVGTAVPRPARLRSGVRGRIGGVARGRRQPAPRPGRRRHAAARSAPADRDLQGSRELGHGRPAPRPPRRRGAGPRREPRQGRPPHPRGPARAAALPRAPGHGRGPLAAALRPRRRRSPAPVPEALAVGADGEPPPLFQALEPYPDNWRAAVCPPGTLPYYPMVLHRGGYPDGS